MPKSQQDQLDDQQWNESGTDDARNRQGGEVVDTAALQQKQQATVYGTDDSSTGTTTPEKESLAQANYQGHLEASGHKSNEAQILSLAKGLVRKKLFRTMKLYKNAGTREMKEMNGVPEKHVQDFFQRELPIALTKEGVWERVKREVSKQLRNKRSSTSEGVKRMFFGKRDELPMKHAFVITS